MSETVKCPFCAEEIKADAKKCKHCGEWLIDELSSNAKKDKVNSPAKEVKKARKGLDTPGFVGLMLLVGLIWGGD